MALDPGIKILLVEDAGTMRKMEVRILNQLGFSNVIEAVDGKDAVEKLQQEAGIQLVISDWAMPEMDGHELLCWMRGQASFKDIPFLSDIYIRFLPCQPVFFRRRRRVLKI